LGVRENVELLIFPQTIPYHVGTEKYGFRFDFPSILFSSLSFIQQFSPD